MEGNVGFASGPQKGSSMQICCNWMGHKKCSQRVNWNSTAGSDATGTFPVPAAEVKLYVFILVYKLIFLQGKGLFDFTAMFWDKRWVHTSVRTASRLLCSVVLFAMTWNLQEQENLLKHHVLQEKQTKKMTFRRKEDVEDTFRTCPEEKLYNVPESMVQKWWINLPHILMFVYIFF